MYSITKNGIKFEWSGGAYIEAFYTNSTQPFDIFNVYDYEKGEPKIKSAEDFSKKVDEIIEWLILEGVLA